MYRYAMFILLALAAAGQASAAQPGKRFSALDVFELEYANDPRVAPDGRSVIYERRSNDIMTDSTRSSLWIVTTDGGMHRPLVAGDRDASSPRWSPDGDRIAFLSGDDSGMDIMLRWMDTRQTAVLATLQTAPDALTWSPDGRWLAFQMDVAATSEPLANPPEKPEGAEWSEPVKLISSSRYRRDGRGFLEPSYTHLFVIPADGGTPRQLTSGEFNHEGPYSWTPDGARIVFSANRDEGWEFRPVEKDVFSISVADGELRQLTDQPGGENDPVVSPDGRRIAYTFDDNRMITYRNQVLYVMDADGTDPVALSADLDRSAGNAQWAGSSRSVWFQFDDRGIRKIARVDLGGDIDVVAEQVGGTSLGRPYTSGTFTVAANDTVAFSRGTSQRPADVAIVDRRGVRVLTALNEDLLGDRALGEVHELTYNSSFDGQEIQGWYITPPGYEPGRRYPLILELHGGPNAAYGPIFAAELQRFAADGYVVFYDNYRGSTSYGEDFALLLQYKYSSPEDFADNMSGIDELIERGIADPDDLFVTGGSAGGIASAYAIGLTDRFSAAAVAKPVINWISKTLTADSYVYQISHQFPAMPWEDPEHYWQRSPLSLVGNVTTPTMLITGEEDYRTPISETEQFYQALQLRGIDVVMVRVPGSSHGIAGRPSRLIAKVDNILAWFAKYRSDLADGD